jgi:lysophospholipase L1-like esterase
MMKYNLTCFVVLMFTVFQSVAKPAKHSADKMFPANDPNITYVGRFDITNPARPRVWTPGAYAEARFTGTGLTVYINDQHLWGEHNIIEIIIDGKAQRLKLSEKENKIIAAQNLAPGEHTVIICKDTETALGYISFAGLQCQKLLPPKKAKHKIEFIGDSITCGLGSDESISKCNTGKWYDQNNAWMSYGAITARQLNAQFMLTSYSGIGLIHSCCGLQITMPQVYDKLQMQADSGQWNFARYTPDVVTICLGQNDGLQDSTAFCSAYVRFINRIRGYYPNARIVCLSSPMANDELRAQMRRYLPAIVKAANAGSGKKVTCYIFNKGYNSGCATHPNMPEQQEIAGLVTGYLKGLDGW